MKRSIIDSDGLLFDFRVRMFAEGRISTTKRYTKDFQMVWYGTIDGHIVCMNSDCGFPTRKEAWDDAVAYQEHAKKVVQMKEAL